jgi:TolB-like protein
MLQYIISRWQLKLLLLWLCQLSFTGCSIQRVAFGDCASRIRTGECQVQPALPDANITITSYDAADKLTRYVPPLLYPGIRLMVMTIADIDNLGRSTSLGRLISENLAARLSQQGYTVIEPKLHPLVNLIPYRGEFALSRNWFEKQNLRGIDIVVAGTYAVAEDKMYISLKMFNAVSRKVMSSYSYTLPLGPNTVALLQKNFWWW